MSMMVIASRMAVSRATSEFAPLRNPFQPVITLSCRESADAAMSQWSLRGIVGAPGEYRVWLEKSNGEWRRLAEGEFIQSNWRVAHIGLRQINMSYSGMDGSCKMISPPVSWFLMEPGNKG